MKKLTQLSILAFTTLTTPLAFAHAGHHDSSWFSGLLHPLTGMDHLLAMVLMGLVAALLGKARGGKLLAGVALSFVTGLTIGTQSQSASLLEPVLMLSVIVLALFAFGLVKRGYLHFTGLIAIAAFGASHGIVLGTEAAGSVIAFSTGATLSSLTLCGLGFGIGSVLLSIKHRGQTATELS